MSAKRQNALLVLVGLLTGLSLSIGHGVFAEREAETAASLPVEELRTFSDVFGRIKNDYVEDVEDKALLENAVRGMLSGLDPHSAYLDQEQFKELQVGTSGEFGGLGIEVGMEDGFVKVIAPIDDTPAQRAGVEAGDLIIRLDDTPVKGLSLNDAVKIMRGKPGTDIVLTIVREGLDAPIKITITVEIAPIRRRHTKGIDRLTPRLDLDGIGIVGMICRAGVAQEVDIAVQRTPQPVSVGILVGTDVLGALAGHGHDHGFRRADRLEGVLGAQVDGHVLRFVEGRI